MRPLRHHRDTTRAAKRAGPRLVAELPPIALRAVRHDLLVRIDLITDAHDVRPPGEAVLRLGGALDAAEHRGGQLREVAVVHGASLVRDDLEVALSRRRKNRRSRRAPKVILAGMIKTSRVVGVILLGLLIALFLPALDVNSTLSVFIAFAVMLVVVSVLAARAEGRRSRGAIARDEARTSGEGRQ
jgi:hypothetical protein